MARSFINIFNVVLAFGQYYNSSQSKVFNSSTKVVNKKIKKVNECMNYFRKTFLIKKRKNNNFLTNFNVFHKNIVNLFLK